MTSRRDNRLSNDVGEIGSDCEIPVQTNGAKRRTSNETSAYTKEPAKDADEKPNDPEVNRTDVRLRDREEHS